MISDTIDSAFLTQTSTSSLSKAKRIRANEERCLSVETDQWITDYLPGGEARGRIFISSAD
jgi:hypothetical protein